MPVFTFRQALPADLPRLLELERRSFPVPWPEGAFAQELELPQAEVWLACPEGDERFAGYVDFWIVGPEVSLLNVAVDPDFRRSGLASQLLALMDGRAAEEAAEAIFLEVRRGNGGARALYERAGYRQVGIRKRYYADTGEDALVLSKSLDG